MAWVQIHASVVHPEMSVATAEHSVGQDPPSWLYHAVTAVRPAAVPSAPAAAVVVVRAEVVVAAEVVRAEVVVRAREVDEEEEEEEEVVAAAGALRAGTASRRPSLTQVLAYAEEREDRKSCEAGSDVTLAGGRGASEAQAHLRTRSAQRQPERPSLGHRADSSCMWPSGPTQHTRRCRSCRSGELAGRRGGEGVSLVGRPQETAGSEVGDD